MISSLFFRIVTVVAVFFVFIYASCKTDPFNCKNEKVGSVNLSKEAKDFFPDIPIQTLIFTDSLGNSRKYTVGRQDLRIFLNVEKLCESINLNTAYYYYEGDAIHYILHNQTDSFAIQLSQASARLKTKKDTAFYDHLAVAHFENQGGAVMSCIVSERGNGNEITQSDKDSQTYRFIQDTVFNGNRFFNVYAGQKIMGSASTSKQNIYVSRTKGLVAFSDDSGKIWVRN